MAIDASLCRERADADAVDALWFNAHEPGLALWLSRQDKLLETVTYAMGDAPVKYGDVTRPWIEMAKEFDDNDRFPSESFKTEAANYLWAVFQELDALREAEE